MDQYDEWLRRPLIETSLGLNVGDRQVVQHWELPIFEAMAEMVASGGGDILEIGFGLGLCASEVMRLGCATYTVVEAHPAIADRARSWAKNQPSPVRIVEEFWQRAMPALETYDGILFDAYPLADEDWNTFKLDFFPYVDGLLRDRGRFSYYTCATRNISQDHVALLLKMFTRAEIRVVEDLLVPPECGFWHDDHMLAVCISKEKKKFARAGSETGSQSGV